jgi:CheY-like chemotaxis protein/HPt (histidine-containing phosphotransfer) domain-containing protein
LSQAGDKSASDYPRLEGEALELLRRLSHDLRTPMTNVLGSTELLLESELNTAQRLAAENVHRSGRDLLDVVDRLLAAHQIGKSAPPSSGEFKAAPRVSAILSGRRVLLAEDNAFNRALIEHVLEPMGCQVDSAHSGTEAVKLFKPGHYDLVLMDCQMPELDGLSATRRIRKLEGGQTRVPVVAVTAGTVSGARRACLDAGMDDFLAKPFSLGRLRQKVLEWLLPRVDSEPPPSDSEDRASEPAAAPPAAPHAPAVDLSRLNELAAEAGSPQIVEELSRIYLDDIAKRLVALGLAAKARDQRAYLNVIHAIKGASGNFGAVGMARIAEASERQAKHGDLSQVDQAVADLAIELEGVRELLDREVFTASAALPRQGLGP